jgi:uncharacterized delta-60 repeat protein
MNNSKFVGTLHAAGLLLLIAALTHDALAASGDLDPSFDPGSGVNGPVYAIAVQPDGKVIIVGGFTTVQGVASRGVARLNADGNGDSSFHSGAYYVGEGLDDFIAVALQPDGKVLVGNDYGVTRLNTNGVIDFDFIVSTAVSGAVRALAVQPDGKILVGGDLNPGIVRLNSNGSLDTNFQSSTYGIVKSVILAPGGKLLVAGVVVNGIARLNSNGSLDNTFNTGTQIDGIASIALLADGKVLIGGSFTSVNGTTHNGIARLGANGALDNTFNASATNSIAVNSVAVQTNGAILIGGDFTLANDASRSRIARLNSDGTLDTSFNPGTGADRQVSSVLLQADGKVFIAGTFTSFNSTNRNRIARLDANGSLDATFFPGRGVDSAVSAVMLQPDGKVLIGDALTFINGTNRYARARLNSDGSSDTTFVPRAFFPDIGNLNGPSDYNVPSCVAVQPDGKVLVGGVEVRNECGDFGCYPVGYYFLGRVTATGSRDTGFQSSLGTQPGENVLAVAVQADGKIFVGGTFTEIRGTSRGGIARLNPNGTLDPGFTPTQQHTVYAIIPQPAGKVLIGGSFSYGNGTNRNGIARLNANGTLDTSFNTGTQAISTVTSIAVQPDGKVLISSYRFIAGVDSYQLIRLNADGGVDSNFSFATAVSGAISSIALQADGNVLVAGGFFTVNSGFSPYVARVYGDSPAPSLNMALSNTFVIVSWPVTSLSFQLRETTNLGLPNAWSAVAQLAVTNGAQISVTVPASAAQKFFRLKSQ